MNPNQSVITTAVEFVRGYAKDHEFFTSDQACDSYKLSGLPMPESGKGWRDLWGGVMTRCNRAGYITKAGKSAPSSSSTHMASVVLWQSRLFTGERTVIGVGEVQLEELRRKWVLREIKDLRVLLWHAYDVGFAQASKAK